MKVHDIKVVQVRHATPNWVSVAGNKLRLAWKATMNGFAKGAQFPCDEMLKGALDRSREALDLMRAAAATLLQVALQASRKMSASPEIG